MKFRKDTKAWQKLKKNLMKLDDSRVQVGWFEGQNYGPDNDNLPIAQVAKWNEEGTRTSPPRPFMRVGFKSEIQNSKAVFEDIIKSVVDGKSPLVALKQSSKAFEDMLKDSINKWDSPPNSPATVDNKGFNNPLIETGTMRDSVSSRIENK